MLSGWKGWHVLSSLSFTVTLVVCELEHVCVTPPHDAARAAIWNKEKAIYKGRSNCWVGIGHGQSRGKTNSGNIKEQGLYCIKLLKILLYNFEIKVYIVFLKSIISVTVSGPPWLRRVMYLASNYRLILDLYILNYNYLWAEVSIMCHMCT